MHKDRLSSWVQSQGKLLTAHPTAFPCTGPLPPRLLSPLPPSVRKQACSPELGPPSVSASALCPLQPPGPAPQLPASRSLLSPLCPPSSEPPEKAEHRDQAAWICPCAQLTSCVTSDKSPKAACLSFSTSRIQIIAWEESQPPTLGGINGQNQPKRYWLKHSSCLLPIRITAREGQPTPAGGSPPRGDPKGPGSSPLPVLPPGWPEDTTIVHVASAGSPVCPAGRGEGAWGQRRGCPLSSIPAGGGAPRLRSGSVAEQVVHGHAWLPGGLGVGQVVCPGRREGTEMDMPSEDC